MKTSKIKIRPFIPSMKDEEIEGREPYAVLKYGNVEVELDYTIMKYLELNIESDLFAKTVSIAHAAFQEIIKEMHVEMDGTIPNLHRDGNHPYLKSIIGNPLHYINKKHIIKE
jgi:hypothetical protein